MPLPLRCRCGHLTGEITLDHAYSRATCYCRDCQAFARHLGRDDITDANGGTDIVPMPPSDIRFDGGTDRLACLSLSPKGLLRWYAACCMTPVANLPRDPGLHYAGVVTACIAAPEADIAAKAGARGRVVLAGKQGTPPVAGTPVALALGGASIFAHILMAKLRGRRASPFFDAGGAPVRAPEVLTLEQRRALGSGLDG